MLYVEWWSKVWTLYSWRICYSFILCEVGKNDQNGGSIAWASFSTQCSIMIATRGAMVPVRQHSVPKEREPLWKFIFIYFWTQENVPMTFYCLAVESWGWVPGSKEREFTADSGFLETQNTKTSCGFPFLGTRNPEWVPVPENPEPILSFLQQGSNRNATVRIAKSFHRHRFTNLK